MVTVGNAPQLADADEFRSAVGDSGSRRYDDTGDTGFGFSYTNSLRDFNIDDQPPCGGATLDHHAAGQPETFSVAASGTAPLSYQWRKNGTAISGATSASYTTPATTTADNAAQFTVVVSNTAGSVTSNDATLNVNAAVVPPSITTQPASQ